MKKNDIIKITGSYHPTLWRTCRVLANERRLKCLRMVIKFPGWCVEEIADAVGISASNASIQLRSLQARGLITAYRESRWVRYLPEPDPIVPSAEPILQTFLKIFAKRHELSDIMKQLTVYTHSRRLRIIKLLQYKAPLDITTVAYHCQMSELAARRHIDKLVNRGVVKLDDDKVALIPPTLLIHSTMAELILKGL